MSRVQERAVQAPRLGITFNPPACIRNSGRFCALIALHARWAGTPSSRRGRPWTGCHGTVTPCFRTVTSL